MPDFDNLPLVLAGPIVRRVEPTWVSVWVALSEARTVRLALWRGETVVPNAGTFFGTGPGGGSADHVQSRASIRVGDKLHLALVTVDLTGSPLTPGESVDYNLIFAGTSDQDLSTEGFLKDDGPDTEPTRLALGYLAGRLPRFTLPPAEIENLRLAHGSCRKAHGHGADGLAALDEVIARARRTPPAPERPNEAPHQLFLTGDQIYADDVAMALLPQLTRAGNALLGTVEELPLTTDTGEIRIPATEANFPTTWRGDLVREQAKMTSGEASCHVMSFGEYCALYLFYWSEVLWDEFATKAALFPECPADQDECNPPDAIVAGLPEHLRPLYPEEHRAGRVGARNALRHKYDQEIEDLKKFKKAIPRVRRVLANVATYMIFDDHEVTDDWNLTRDWKDRVHTSPLGVTILRNGLMSYLLFQGWGNLPARFTEGDHAQLMSRVQALFPDGGGFDTAAANQIDALLGFGATPSPIAWHYTVPTGPTTTAVLDTRTRRIFHGGRYGPPGLVAPEGLRHQLPDEIDPSPGAELVFVVSAAPVLGLALIEELAQPLGGRAGADFFVSVVARQEPRIGGYKEFDMEAWSLDARAFEALMARFHELKRVVVLSGDVHYGCAAEMDYWKRHEPEATRVVQFTSSALKNELAAKPKRALETVAGQELLHGAFYPMSRMGWNDPLSLVGQVGVPGGSTIPRTRRALMRREPAVLPVEGWPGGTTIGVTPDWVWRTRLVKDERPDDDSDDARPSDARLDAIDPDLNPAAPVPGYVAVLRRGEQQVKKKVARAVVFASNVGLVRITGDPGARIATQDLVYPHPESRKADDPQVYTSYRVPLAATGDDPPSVS